MALSKKLLSRDEVVVRHMHTHIKALLWRIILEVVLVVIGIVGSVLAPASWSPWGLVGIWVVVLVASVPLLVVPWLQWYAHTYTVTTKRIITRSGVFGCGTLALQTSADDPLLLHDVPQVEMVQVEISNLLFNDVQGAIDVDPRS